MATFAEQMVEKIESVMLDRAAADVQEYELAGRKMVKIPLAELLTLRERFKGEVRQEQAAARLKLGKSTRQKIVVRF